MFRAISDFILSLIAYFESEEEPQDEGCPCCGFYGGCAAPEGREAPDAS